MFTATARYGLLPGAALPVQPADMHEAAVVVADTVEAEASGETTQFAGREVRTPAGLAATWRLEIGRRAPILPVPLLGDAARALRAGGLTHPGAWRGRTAFADWLRKRGGTVPAARATAMASAA